MYSGRCDRGISAMTVEAYVSGALSPAGGKLTLEYEDYALVGEWEWERVEKGVSPTRWEFPVIPPAAWYCATVHDLTGVKNNGYRHSGIDLNLDRSPWGDVDQGQPVFAVHSGAVYRCNYHRNYLGCVIVLGKHKGLPLYTRYWHLADDSVLQNWQEGGTVKPGQVIGHIGNYRLGAGGDHLHFDMALDPFEPCWWHTRHPNVRWIDPIPVLKAHLMPDEVDKMMGRRDG